MPMGGDAEGRIRAGCGLGVGDDWHQALSGALEQALAPLAPAPPDLLLVFAGADYRQDFSDLIHAAAERSGARNLAGCSASGVIAGGRELEDAPGLAVLAVRLPPSALLSVRHVGPDQISDSHLVGIDPGACHGILLLADPFTTDAAALIGTLERDYPSAPIVGGLATGLSAVHWTSVFHGSEVADAGAVVVGLGGSVRLRPVVSQGCEPIGQPWTITRASDRVIESIGNRSAYQVLVETVRRLDDQQRERVNGNLLVGLAMDEYRDEFKRGDFLICNLLGVDRSTGSIAVGGYPRLGQTLQFQVRDARAADTELRQMLGAASDEDAAAALLFACNGRGAGLFGGPDHDARMVREILGPVPLAGLFCNGEIGPVGAATYLHGYTASLALLTRLAPARA
jgi:small ligand-binding sensory domain FIST